MYSLSLALYSVFEWVLTGTRAVGADVVAHDLVLDEVDGVRFNRGFRGLVALKRVEDLLLDRRDPGVPLVLTGRLEVPLLVVQRHQDELIAVVVWSKIKT